MINDRQDRPLKVLILQGDWEYGMIDVAKDLILSGVEVVKVNFNIVDNLFRFHGIPSVSFDDKLECFEEWLNGFIDESSIDTILIYNQYRPYNKIGWEVAQRKNMECLVLELGLIRPDYMTIYSREYDLNHYLKKRWNEDISGELADYSEPEYTYLNKTDTPTKVVKMGVAVLYTRLAMVFLRKYKYFTDQRSVGFLYHFIPLIRNSIRFYKRGKQRYFDTVLKGEWSGNYYLCPLQVHCDSQITIKSDYENMEEFIREVAISFINNAPAHTHLVYKVHPMDRGYIDYANYIEELAKELKTDRFIYVDRIHLPTALEHARGCVTVNSSVGLSALIHHTPTITLGEAVYDLKELTFEGTLDEFWEDLEPVKRKYVRHFLRLLKQTSQAKGVLYKKLLSTHGHAKISWPPMFRYLFAKKKHDI